MGYTEVNGCGIRQHILSRNKNTNKTEVFTQEDQTFTGRKTFLSGVTTSDLEVQTVEVSESLKVKGKDITEIIDYLPNDVSKENKLTTKDFVNSSIATNTANFLGTFNTLEEIEALTDVTNNDYAFWKTTDTLGSVVFKRYKYIADEQLWKFEYDLNNSSFTAEQWAAINSGITEELVAQIGQGGPLRQIAFDSAHPVNDKYIQFPGDPEPEELYNKNGIQSTWQDISSHFAGLSMRFAGGLAEDFNKQLTVQSKNGNKVTFTAAHGLTLGSLIVNLETHTQYSISTIDSETVVTLNETPVDLQNNTTVLICQNDQFQGHAHLVPYIQATQTGTYDYPIGGGKNPNTRTTTTILSDGINGAPRTGHETRSKNATVRLWKRIS